MAAAPVYPDFPKDEFEQRYHRARALMDEQQLDALFVTALSNYEYFTGHRSDQNYNDKARPYIFLLPRNGEPACFVPAFETGHVKMTTWIEQVRSYPLMQHNAVIAESIRDLGLANGRIGCELGREQFLKLSYNDFNALKALVPDTSLVDASDVFLRLRAIKSPAEIARCREAADITVNAVDRALSMVKPGTTNLEVARLLRREIADGGGEKIPSLRVYSSHDFLATGTVSYPTSRRLEVGDTLTVDIGTQYRGYLCDIARTAVIGQASQEQKDMYQFVLDLNQICYDVFRPGALCEDVPLTCQRELERLGRTTQAVGRVGHGVGCDSLEYPSLAVGEKVRMEPGMIFACNPNFVTNFGYFNVEEDLVVTENGYDLLPDPLAPRELQVLG